MMHMNENMSAFAEKSLKLLVLHVAFWEIHVFLAH